MPNLHQEEVEKLVERVINRLRVVDGEVRSSVPAVRLAVQIEIESLSRQLEEAREGLDEGLLAEALDLAWSRSGLGITPHPAQMNLLARQLIETSREVAKDRARSLLPDKEG